MLIQDTLTFHIMASLIVVTLFYYHTKLFIFNHALRLAKAFKITHRFPTEMAKGVVELPIVVIAHLIFSFILIYFLTAPSSTIRVFYPKTGTFIFLGFLLGIGMMGFASLLSRFVIELLRPMRLPHFPQEVKDWISMTRSGWLRHHLHTLEAFFIPLALLVTLGQICGEEIVFRGVMTHYFISFGSITAVIIPTLLFMFMQVFHMPTLTSAIFPVIGSMVIGITDCILYLHVPSLIPLIVAHLTFFTVAVL